MIAKKEIINLEVQLRKAMLENDIEMLDSLISNDLVFVAMNGSIVSKKDDLNVHKQNLQMIHKFEQSEQNIKLFEDVAVVSVKADIECTFLGQRQKGLFRYLRVWQKNNNKWQVILGSMTQIVE